MYAHGIRRLLNTGTDAAEARGLIVNRYLEPQPGQKYPCAQAANAGANNGD